MKTFKQHQPTKHLNNNQLSNQLHNIYNLTTNKTTKHIDDLRTNHIEIKKPTTKMI